MNDALSCLLQTIGRESLDYCNQNRLELIADIAKKAQLLDWNIPIISVTGTNGKGSSVAALRAIYQAAGYRAGVFTSPHLIEFNERIAINDTPISDEAFLDALTSIVKLDIRHQLSFFEYLTVAALYYFKQQQPDVLIMEVGLGGRLDAINILNADVVLFTPIDLDHQAILGNTIEAIAFEKAGLLRPHAHAVFSGVVCPVSLYDRVVALEVAFKQFNRDFMIIEDNSGWQYKDDNVSYHFTAKPKVHLSAMASAIQVCQLLQSQLPVSAAHITQAVEHVFIAGRYQWIDDKVMTVLDVGHNPHAVRLLVERLSQENIHGKIHVVFSALRDKDCHQIVEIFNKLVPLWYTCLLDSDRSHNQDSLELLFEQLGVKHQFNGQPLDAFKQARANANAEDVIVVFGSFYLVRDVILLLKQEGKYVF